MMATEKNYLSEFEQEWNSEFETTDVQNDAYELEVEDEEMDSDDELESGDDFETSAQDDSYEMESGEDHEQENGMGYNYEDRLYNVLNGDHESELEFEHDLNEVLHEMEKDYFWKGLKSKWNKFKKGKVFAALRKVADATPIGSTIKQYTALARGDIKGFAKNLAGQALSAMGPGGGMAKQLLNLETPVANGNLRNSARYIHQATRNAYGNLVNQLTSSVGNPGKAKDFGKMAVQQAVQSSRTRSGGRRHRITIGKNDVLIVRVQ